MDGQTHRALRRLQRLQGRILIVLRFAFYAGLELGSLYLCFVAMEHATDNLMLLLNMTFGIYLHLLVCVAIHGYNELITDPI